VVATPPCTADDACRPIQHGDHAATTTPPPPASPDRDSSQDQSTSMAVNFNVHVDVAIDPDGSSRPSTDRDAAVAAAVDRRSLATDGHSGLFVDAAVGPDRLGQGRSRDVAVGTEAPAQWVVHHWPATRVTGERQPQWTQITRFTFHHVGPSSPSCWSSQPFPSARFPSFIPIPIPSLILQALGSASPAISAAK